MAEIATELLSREGVVPPYPYRSPTELTPLQRLRLAQKNLISVFEDAAFEIDFAAIKILTKHIFLCNSPETVQYAFGLKNEHFERKSPTMRHMLRPLIGDGLFISEGETWRKRRRIVSPIVQATRLSAFAPVMTDNATAMADRWAGLPEGASIDALSEMAQLTAGIISQAIFGRQLAPEQASEVVAGFSAFQHAISRIDLLSLLGAPDWVPRPRRAAVYRSVRRIHGVIDEIVAKPRNHAGAEDVSVIGRLTDARDADTGKPLDATAIRNEAVVIFMAGHETTANTLAFTWYLLSQAPDVEARLHEEIDAVLGDRPPMLSDVPKLVYTRAIIEALRLYPPIPILAREAIVDESINGHHVPKGSLVLVAPWLLHRNRNLWDRPDHFLPERFLAENRPTPDKWSYVPFSIGPRTCAGMAFGLTELIICLAALAQRFTLRLAAGHRMMPICRVSLRPGDTLPMTVHHRRSQGPAGKPSREVVDAPAATCPFHHC